MLSDRLAAWRTPRQKQKWLWFLCFIVPDPAAADVEREVFLLLYHHHLFETSITIYLGC
jgi:hypothetical protein